MKKKILCDHCETEAVAELYGSYLCPGCLMSIVVCEDDAVPVHALEKFAGDAPAYPDSKSRSVMDV